MEFLLSAISFSGRFIQERQGDIFFLKADEFVGNVLVDYDLFIMAD